MRAPFTLALVATALVAGTLRAEVPHDVVAHERARRPSIAVLVNPALAPLGRVAGRVEVAVLDSQAVFVEPAWLDYHVPAIDRTVRGGQVDFGWHLYPSARGLRGPFLGVRGTVAHGATGDATATLAGAGFDLGWSWALPGGAAFQLGGGLAWARMVAKPTSAALPRQIDVLEPAQRAQLENATVSAGFLLPVATTGVGVAF